MNKLLAIALTVVTLMFGLPTNLVPGPAVAHHNVYHSLGKCGVVSPCPAERKQVRKKIRPRPNS